MQKIKNKKVLITGGAGFIGTHMAERLALENAVTLLDIDLNGPLRFSRLKNDAAVKKIQGDVRDFELVKREVSQADLVLHFASLIGVKRVIENARDTIDTIFYGTRNVLEAARQNSKLERLINISTSEVYGSTMDAVEGAPASIGTDNDARLSYGSAKLLGEHLVWAYQRDFKIPSVIIRPFNIYGAMRTASHAVGLFVVKALAGRDINIHGDGSQIRSWCYIDDFCDAIETCLSNPGAAGQDFNIGNLVTAVTIYDLAHRIVRLTGSKSKVTTTPHAYSDIGVRALKSEKAREILNYSAKFDLDSGLNATINWYREHLPDFELWLS